MKELKVKNINIIKLPDYDEYEKKTSERADKAFKFPGPAKLAHRQSFRAGYEYLLEHIKKQTNKEQ